MANEYIWILYEYIIYNIFSITNYKNISTESVLELLKNRHFYVCFCKFLRLSPRY